MNKWIITGLVVVALLVIVGVLNDQGVFVCMRWEGMAIALSAIAAPYMALKNFLFGNKTQKDFKVKYNEMRDETVKHRVDLDERIGAKEKRIAELDKELQLIEAKMDVLELKKKNVQIEVNRMTIEETHNETQDLFGD